MSQESIASYYERDHDRLDNLFNRFQESKKTDFPKAKQSFREFVVGLKRHIVWEEDILFPLFEERTNTHGAGPTVVMRVEHCQIKEVLERIHEKVRKADPTTDLDETLLLALLQEHNMKEEQILYPLIGQSLSKKERENVFTRMVELSEKQNQSCCGIHHLEKNKTINLKEKV